MSSRKVVKPVSGVAEMFRERLRRWLEERGGGSEIGNERNGSCGGVESDEWGRTSAAEV